MNQKITLFISLFCFALLSRLQAQAPPEILHYNFNGTGTLIPNMASTPPLGTTNASIVGTQSLGGTGQCGSALVGDGSTSSYVNTAWTTSLSGSWTISFWTASITPSSTLWYIFGDVNAGSFRCFTNGVAGANNWILRGTGLTDITISGGAVMTPQLNTFVYNSTTGVTTGYLNGVFNASVTQAPVTITGTGPFKVGQYGSNNGLPAGGLMDEFRVYSRALTLTEIQSLSSFVPTSTNITVTSCGTYTSSGNNTYSTSGTYTENVVTCGGNATNTINLTVNPVPTLTVTASSSVLCNGESSNLITNGTATSFTWNTGANTSSISVAPTTNTSYVVTGSLSTCSISQTVNVNVNPTPFVSVSISNPSICLGGSITLNASGAPVYSWSPVTSSSASVVDFPTVSTTYSVTGTNTFGCSNTKTVGIIVNSFTPGITAPFNICAGNQANINATGGAGTSYTWSTNFTGFASITVTPAITTTYSVNSIGPNGCPGSNATTVTVNPNPTVTASAQRTVMCKGETNTLTASGANTYSWSNNNSGSSVVFTATSNVTTNYIVTGYNSSGCSDSATVTVKVNLCTGLTSNGGKEVLVSVYPNPFNGSFTILSESVESDMQVAIYDISGSLIRKEKILSQSTLVDLKTEPAGVYFMHILKNDTRLEIVKLIKE